MLYLTYKATYLDSINDTETTEYGIVATETIPQALEELSNLYGQNFENVIDITLDIGMADTVPYIFSKETYEALNEERRTKYL